METQPTIEFSRRLYVFLLGFYPKSFRTEYGSSMLQVFTDQCRAAAAGRGSAGLVVLWLRTLADLAASLVREHLAAPRDSWGLLEATPGKPLPWTGVILVLVPCLIFLFGQIGQIAGQDVFFVLVRRAGYFLILPVLLVWALTRKFPVWGLAPLGIFYYTIRNVLENFEGYLAKYGGTILYPIAVFGKANDLEVRVGIVLFLIVLSAVFAAVIFRGQKASRSTRVWGVLFILLLLPAALRGVYYVQQNMPYLLQNDLAGGLGSNYADPRFVLRDMIGTSYVDVAYILEYLLLILAGAFLARRHGRLALLFPLGFIIPFVLVGRFDATLTTTGFLVWSSIAVFAYRVMVTLIAPIWIVRSGSDEGQGRAGVVGFATSIGIVILAHLGSLANYGISNRDLMGTLKSIVIYGSWNGIDLPSLYFELSPAIIIFTGIALAISLYRRMPEKAAKAMLKAQPATAT